MNHGLDIQSVHDREIGLRHFLGGLFEQSQHGKFDKYEGLFIERVASISQTITVTKLHGKLLLL